MSKLYLIHASIIEINNSKEDLPAVLITDCLVETCSSMFMFCTVAVVEPGAVQGFGWAIAKALAEAGAEISLGVWVSNKPCC